MCCRSADQSRGQCDKSTKGFKLWKPGNAIEVKDLKITYKCVKSLSREKCLFHLRKSKLEVYEAREVSLLK